MSGYFVLQIEWLDSEARGSYVERLGNLLSRHGGEIIVASKDFAVVEGTWKPGLLVILRFPTVNALRDWYDSPEYRPLRELRLGGSRSDAIVAEGD